MSINTHLSRVLLPKAKDFYKVGEIVKINDISVKIDKMERSNGNKTSKPDEGFEYLVVTISAKSGYISPKGEITGTTIHSC